MLDGMSPRVLVLMIGTNDLYLGVSPKDTAAGVAALVTNLRLDQPQAQVLLLGILPRGATPDLPLRQAVSQTNDLLARLADGSSVHFLDIGSAFLRPDGTLSPAVMADFLHPTALGYTIESATLVGPLGAMLSTITRSVNAALGPSGEVIEVVLSDGTLFQVDAGGVQRLVSGVRTASVAFGPSGEVLVLVASDGTLIQVDATGTHVLGGGVFSASVTLGLSGELLDVLFADGNFLQLDAQGVHRPDTF
jgi:hypothetical protein